MRRRILLSTLSKNSNQKDQRFSLSNIIHFLCIGLVLLVVFIIYKDYVMLISESPDNDRNNTFDSMECLRQVLNELPIGKGRLKKYKSVPKKIEFEHHYTANTGLWNMEQRFNPIPGLTTMSNSCAIWEVGAHILAKDSETFSEMYPHCEYHAYEPVPDFYQQLEANWQEKKTKEGVAKINFTAHNYGIDSSDTKLKTSTKALKGEGSYLGDTIDADKDIVNLQIKSFSNVLKEASGKIPILFNVNCEGCEWEMLPNLLTSASQAKLFRSIPIIQFGTHNYGKNLGQRAWELCKIREQLSESHRMVFGVAFGWERWVKK